MYEKRPKGAILRGIENKRGGLYLVSPENNVTPFFHKVGDVSEIRPLSGHEWLFGRFFDGLCAYARTNGFAYLSGARKGGDFSCDQAECSRRLAAMFHLESANSVIGDEAIENESDFRQVFLNGILPKLKLAADTLIDIMEAEGPDWTILPMEDIAPYAAIACDPIEAQQTRLVFDRFDDNDCVNFTSIVEENAPFTLARMENNGFSPTPENMFKFVEKRCLPYGKTAVRDGSLITFKSIPANGV